MSKPMHVLIVIDHPDPGSFTHAVARRFADGLTQQGAGFEFADLHAEEFNPIWTMDDVEQAQGAPQDVLREQVRIGRADAVCFVFPLFWFSMPAMMKGWMDRVWTYGWAYDQIGDPNLSLQKSRTAVMLIPAGGNPDAWPQHGLDTAMDSLWTVGMLGYFGFTEKHIHILGGSEGSDDRRAGLLQQAYDAGLTLAADGAHG